MNPPNAKGFKRGHNRVTNIPTRQFQTVQYQDHSRVLGPTLASVRDSKPQGPREAHLGTC